MNPDDLQVFIKEVTTYFNEVTGEAAQLDVPYNKGEETLLLDYTGFIGISGSRKGGLYITCTHDMLKELTSIIMQGEEVDDETILDMIGEIANTISGNARTTFGKNFMISVPSIFQGQPEDFRIVLKSPVIAIPINWKSHKSFLVLGLE